MRHASWYWAWVVGVAGLAGCASNGPGAEAAPSAVTRLAEEGSFIDDDGNVVPLHGAHSLLPSDLGPPNDLVRIRCQVSVEGFLFACTQLRGPRSVEDRIVAALKRVRVAPNMENGKPVEGSRVFTVRVRFFMR